MTTHLWWSSPSSCTLRWMISVPYVLLLLVTNQGMLHHVVDGRQIRDSPHRDRNNHMHNGHPTLHHQSHQHHHHQQGGIHSISNIGNPHQYTSFEEFQRAMENPFDNNTGVNITVPLGDTAFLRCKVRNLGERSISWIRRRDWHILSTGKATYTNDERFHVLHSDGSDEWTLQIKFVQKRDNGTYECQVSTGTGVASYYVHLVVAVPEAFILGNGEYHVEQGSTINLVCIIEKSPKPPEYIFWYHNDRMINYGSIKELSIHTEPGTGKTHSRLIIQGAQLGDSGNYTCKAANADPASIMVYVSQASGLYNTGEQNVAAIQDHKTASSSATSSSKSASSIVLTSSSSEGGRVGSGANFPSSSSSTRKTISVIVPLWFISLAMSPSLHSFLIPLFLKLILIFNLVFFRNLNFN